MKTYFRYSLSSFLTLLVLMFLAIALTGSSILEEKTVYGATATSNKGYTITETEGQLTFFLPSTFQDRCFKDTKYLAARDYLKAIHAIFLAEADNGDMVELIEENVTLRDCLSTSTTQSTAIEAYLRTEVTQYLYANYTLLEYSYEGMAELNGVPAIHVVYTMGDESRREFALVSDYIVEKDGVLREIRLTMYDRTPLALSDLKKLEEHFSETIDSFYVAGPVSQKEQISFWTKASRYSFSLWIFLLPLFFILLGFVRVKTNYDEWHEDAYSVSHSKELMGILAVFIVLHHLVQEVGAGKGIMQNLEYLGVCFVGVFFFYSGYGLMVSYHTKQDYLKGFLKKRLVTVLLPFYTCNLIFVATGLLTGHIGFDKLLIFRVTGLWLLNGHMWYIIEIVLLYLLFYLIFRFLKRERLALLFMGLSCLAIVSISLFLGHGNGWFMGEWWYNTTFLFLIGMLFARYQKQIVSYVRAHYKTALIVSGIAWLILFVATRYMLEKHGYWSEYNGISYWWSIRDKWMTLSVQLPMVIAFVAFVLILSQRVQCRNGVLRFLGSISLELYLIHNLFIQNFGQISGRGMFCLAVLVASILAATILHQLDCVLLCKLQKRALPKQIRILPIVQVQFNSLSKDIVRCLLYCGRHKKKVVRYLIREIICILLCLVAILPLYRMVVIATKADGIFGNRWLPSDHFIENLASINGYFRYIGGDAYLGLINSTIVAVSTALLATYFGAMCAYAFERYDFKGKAIFWKLVILSLFMPQAVGFAGLYQVLASAKLLNHYIPVILMASANPAAVYLIRLYLKNISLTEIVEAARIDGTNEYFIFNRIIIPLISPVLALQMIFSFVAAWNNGFAQSLMLYDWNKKTISSYIRMISGGQGNPAPDEYALMLLAVLPPLIVYILCSKSIISSITLGGVKE